MCACHLRPTAPHLHRQREESWGPVLSNIKVVKPGGKLDLSPDVTIDQPCDPGPGPGLEPLGHSVSSSMKWEQ